MLNYGIKLVSKPYLVPLHQFTISREFFMHHCVLRQNQSIGGSFEIALVVSVMYE